MCLLNNHVVAKLFIFGLISHMIQRQNYCFRDDYQSTKLQSIIYIFMFYLPGKLCWVPQEKPRFLFAKQNK